MTASHPVTAASQGRPPQSSSSPAASSETPIPATSSYAWLTSAMAAISRSTNVATPEQKIKLNKVDLTSSKKDIIVIKDDLKSSLPLNSAIEEKSKEGEVKKDDSAKKVEKKEKKKRTWKETMESMRGTAIAIRSNAVALYAFLKPIPWTSLGQEAILSASPLALIAFFSILESTRSTLVDSSPLMDRPLPGPIRKHLAQHIESSLNVHAWAYPILAGGLLIATFVPQFISPAFISWLMGDSKSPIKTTKKAPHAFSLLPPPSPLRTFLSFIILLTTIFSTISILDLSTSVSAHLREVHLSPLWTLNEATSLRFFPDPKHHNIHRSLLVSFDDGHANDESLASSRSSFVKRTQQELIVPHPPSLTARRRKIQDNVSFCPVKLHLEGSPYVRFYATSSSSLLPPSFVDPGVTITCHRQFVHASSRNIPCRCPVRELESCVIVRSISQSTGLVGVSYNVTCGGDATWLPHAVTRMVHVRARPVAKKIENSEGKVLVGFPYTVKGDIGGKPGFEVYVERNGNGTGRVDVKSIEARVVGVQEGILGTVYEVRLGVDGNGDMELEVAKRVGSLSGVIVLKPKCVDPMEKAVCEGEVKVEVGGRRVQVGKMRVVEEEEGRWVVGLGVSEEVGVLVEDDKEMKALQSNDMWAEVTVFGTTDVKALKVVNLKEGLAYGGGKEIVIVVEVPEEFLRGEFKGIVEVGFGSRNKKVNGEKGRRVVGKLWPKLEVVSTGKADLHKGSCVSHLSTFTTLNASECPRGSRFVPFILSTAPSTPLFVPSSSPVAPTISAPAILGIYAADLLNATTSLSILDDLTAQGVTCPKAFRLTSSINPPFDLFSKTGMSSLTQWCSPLSFAAGDSTKAPHSTASRTRVLLKRPHPPRPVTLALPHPHRTARRELVVGIVVAPPPTAGDLHTLFRGRMYAPSLTEDHDVPPHVSEDGHVDMTVLHAEIVHTQVAPQGVSGAFSVFRVSFRVPSSVPVVKDGWVGVSFNEPIDACKDSVHPFAACEPVWVFNRIVGVVEPVEVSKVVDEEEESMEVLVTLSGGIQTNPIPSDLFTVTVLAKPAHGSIPLLEERSFVAAGDGDEVNGDQPHCFVPGTALPVKRVVRIDGRTFRVTLGVKEGEVAGMVKGEKVVKGGWGWFGRKEEKEETGVGGVLFVAVGEGKAVGGDLREEEEEEEEKEDRRDAVSCRPFAVDLDEFSVRRFKPRASSPRRSRAPKLATAKDTTSTDSSTPTSAPEMPNFTPITSQPIEFSLSALFFSALLWLVTLVRRLAAVAVLGGGLMLAGLPGNGNGLAWCFIGFVAMGLVMG